MCFVRRARKSEVPVKIDENWKFLISNFDACAWFRRCVLFFSPLASCFSLLTSSPCVECARAPGARRFRVIFRTSFEVFKFSHSVDYVSGYDPNFSGHSLHDSAHSAGPDLEGSAKKNFFGQKRPDRVGARFRCPPCSESQIREKNFFFEKIMFLVCFSGYCPENHRFWRVPTYVSMYRQPRSGQTACKKGA